MRIHYNRILKIITTITHPVPLIIFLLILPVNPGHENGFFFNYLLEGLQDMRFYAFCTVAGIGVLLYSLVLYKRSNYFTREVLKAKCKWSWLNSIGIMFIGFAIPSFYSLSFTPSFIASIHNNFFLITFILFYYLCRLFLGFNLAFVVFSVLQDQFKAEYYDDDDFYGEFEDPDSYLEI